MVLAMKHLVVYMGLMIFFLTVGILMKQSMQKHTDEEAWYQARVAAEQRETEVLVRELNTAMKNAASPEAWEIIMKDQFLRLSKRVGEAEQVRIKNLLLAKLAESYMQQMEKKIASAQQFFAYDQNHPQAKKYMSDALAWATKAEDVVALLPETFDDRIFTAQWLYRLALFAIEKTAFVTEDAVKISDLLELARSKLRKVLTYLPKDRNVQTALELLERKQEEIESSGSSGGSNRQQVQQQIIMRMLPQRPTEEFQMSDVMGTH